MSDEAQKKKPSAAVQDALGSWHPVPLALPRAWYDIPPYARFMGLELFRHCDGGYQGLVRTNPARWMDDICLQLEIGGPYRRQAKSALKLLLDRRLIRLCGAFLFVDMGQVGAGADQARLGNEPDKPAAPRRRRNSTPPHGATSAQELLPLGSHSDHTLLQSGAQSDHKPTQVHENNEVSFLKEREEIEERERGATPSETPPLPQPDPQPADPIEAPAVVLPFRQPLGDPPPWAEPPEAPLAQRIDVEYRKQFLAAKQTTPPRAVDMRHAVKLADWLAENAAAYKTSPFELAKRAISSLLKHANAHRHGYPLKWVADNPQEFVGWPSGAAKPLAPAQQTFGGGAVLGHVQTHDLYPDLSKKRLAGGA